MGGVTNNTITGDHYHCYSFPDDLDTSNQFSNEELDGYISGYSYWYDPDDQEPKRSIGSECFAEMYSYEITGNTTMENGTRAVLENSYNTMEGLIDVNYF